MRKSISIIVTLGFLLGTAALFQNCAEDIDISQYGEGASTAGSGNTSNPPQFTSAPANVSVTLLQPINITVSTRGQVDAYVWYKNDVLLPSVTGPTLSYAEALESHAGNYRVVIRNIHGENPANFQVTVTRLPNQIAPVIAAPVLPVTGVHYFVNGADSGVFITGTQAAPYNVVTFSVVAQSAETITYQWYKVNAAGTPVAISGATAATYTFQTLTNLDSGLYRVLATNRFGSTMSEARLTITIEEINFNFAF